MAEIDYNSDKKKETVENRYTFDYNATFNTIK